MKKFPCAAFGYDGDIRLASEALLEDRVNINDHDLMLHREIARLTAKVRDMERRLDGASGLVNRLLSWQTQASTFLTPREKVFVAEKVVYLERGRPRGFRFTTTPSPRGGR